MKQMRCKNLSGYGRSPPTFVHNEQKLRCKESKKKRMIQNIKVKITTILEIRCCGLFLLEDNKLSKRNWRNYAKRTAEYQRKFD